MASVKKRHRPLTLRSVSLDIIKLFIAALFVFAALFPLAWMTIAGFKMKTEVVKTPFQFFPEVWNIQNYVDILSDAAFLRTLVVTGSGAVLFTVLSILVNSLAAYAFARLEFRFKKILWAVAITTMFIPAMTILLTSFLVVTELGMLNSMAVLVIPGAASAMQMFFIRQFYLNIPSSLEEAALLDGASKFQIYTRLFLPLSKAPFVVVGVTSFMAFWNAYVWPIMVITSPDLFQVQQYLATFRSERSSELALLMAGSTLAATPVIVLFVIFQKQIIGNIKLSGIK
ncbi:MAG: carbohydrate ABC transporter permease [Arcanobacterium sp.]|nr:carbohydrate ABC transporter permease [Arcanobacterium sp.]MDY5589156.1 carbohydrate ABC transporter permease [Arcanobacterium sp.]